MRDGELPDGAIPLLKASKSKSRPKVRGKGNMLPSPKDMPGMRKMPAPPLPPQFKQPKLEKPKSGMHLVRLLHGNKKSWKGD